MRKKEFIVSAGLKLSVLMILIVTFSACQTVFTINPLPTADSPEITTLPALLAGDFQIMDGENHTDNEVGHQYVRIALINNQRCLIESYMGFDLEQLAAHPRTERFRLEGDYLIYKNDSLIQELSKAKAQVEASPDNQEYKKDLKALKYMAENGYMDHIIPITKRGHLITYDRELTMEIDLTENKFLSYDEQRLAESGSPIIKFQNNKLFINNHESDNGWETIILELTDDALLASTISFKHVLKNKAHYEKTVNLNQPSRDVLVINPALSELNEMFTEEGFLQNQMTLKRIELKEGKIGEKPSWWLITLGALVLVLILRVMRRPQVQN